MQEKTKNDSEDMDLKKRQNTFREIEKRRQKTYYFF
jgi:hypothetical protein